MGLDNVAVHWPRTGRFYDPVAPAEFVDFGEIADVPRIAAPTAALAEHIAKTGTVRATAYTELVDLLLGLEGVLYATDAAAEDEDPVIDPDGCAWIAGGLERFVAGHRAVRRGGDLRIGQRRCCARCSATAGWPSSSCAGWTAGSTRCATSRRPAAVELHLRRAGRAGRASTAAAPTAASPSTPTPEPGRRPGRQPDHVRIRAADDAEPATPSPGLADSSRPSPVRRISVHPRRAQLRLAR